ncbi:MAG: DUF6502 family protein [Gammaproteobacteria bacterium]
MSNALKSAALSALRAAVRPLFSVLLRSGVTWQEASEVCKSAMVEVATDEFGLHGRPTNMSRVAIMTGLSRREVRRLRDQLKAGPQPDTERMNGATGVLTGWYLDPDFLGDSGQPRDLPYDAGSAGLAAPAFADLCKRYGGDLAPITMRRELVRVGAVTELSSGQLRVVKRYYMPLQMDPEAVLRGGSMLADLGTTVSFNLGKPEDDPSRFAGRAINTRIRNSDLRRYQAFLEGEGQAFLERVDVWLSSQELPPGEDAGKRGLKRVGVGVYGIQDESDP